MPALGRARAKSGVCPRTPQPRCTPGHYPPNHGQLRRVLWRAGIGPPPRSTSALSTGAASLGCRHCPSRATALLGPDRHLLGLPCLRLVLFRSGWCGCACRVRVSGVVSGASSGRARVPALPLRRCRSRCASCFLSRLAGGLPPRFDGARGRRLGARHSGRTSGPPQRVREREREREGDGGERVRERERGREGGLVLGADPAARRVPGLHQGP